VEKGKGIGRREGQELCSREIRQVSLEMVLEEEEEEEGGGGGGVGSVESSTIHLFGVVCLFDNKHIIFLQKKKISTIQQFF